MDFHAVYNLYVSQILIIGKSINFLRQSCEDHTQLGAASLRNWYLDEQGSLLDVLYDCCYYMIS